MSDKQTETQTMNINGYIPVYRELGSEDDWKPIPVRQSKFAGVPTPALFGHALRLVGCYGHAQALALAWLFVAECEANSERYVYEVGTQRQSVQIETISKRDFVLVAHPSVKNESAGDIYTPVQESDKPDD